MTTVLPLKFSIIKQVEVEFVEDPSWDHWMTWSALDNGGAGDAVGRPYAQDYYSSWTTKPRPLVSTMPHSIDTQWSWDVSVSICSAAGWLDDTEKRSMDI